MVARAWAPCWISPIRTAVTVKMVLGARGQTEVHQMGDGSLALAATGGTHGDLCRGYISVTFTKGKVGESLQLPQWHPRSPTQGV